jgi:hypothetical protein
LLASLPAFLSLPYCNHSLPLRPPSVLLLPLPLLQQLYNYTCGDTVEFNTTLDNAYDNVPGQAVLTFVYEAPPRPVGALGLQATIFDIQGVNLAQDGGGTCSAVTSGDLPGCPITDRLDGAKLLAAGLTKTVTTFTSTYQIEFGGTIVRTPNGASSYSLGSYSGGSSFDGYHKFIYGEAGDACGGGAYTAILYVYCGKNERLYVINEESCTPGLTYVSPEVRKGGGGGGDQGIQLG